MKNKNFEIGFDIVPLHMLKYKETTTATYLGSCLQCLIWKCLGNSVPPSLYLFGLKLSTFDNL